MKACRRLGDMPMQEASEHIFPFPAAHRMDVPLLSVAFEPPQNHLVRQCRWHSGTDSS